VAIPDVNYDSMNELLYVVLSCNEPSVVNRTYEDCVVVASLSDSPCQSPFVLSCQVYDAKGCTT
jgi:hypothetical protein